MFNLPSRSRSVDYTFNMRDNLAFQCFQSLIESGKPFNGYAITAVEAYELADAFVVQVIHEKKDGK